MSDWLKSIIQRLRQFVRRTGDDDDVGGLDEAIAWAQEATAQRDWAEAVERWNTLLTRFEAVVPSKAFSRLAIAYREAGDLESAGAVLDQGRSRFPGDKRLALNWAQLAMAGEDWVEAAERWEVVLERFDADAVPPKAYAWLAISYREMGYFGRAAAVLDWARIQHPGELKLELEWVELALTQKDWDDAVRRCREILTRMGEETPSKVFARLAIAYRELGEFDRSQETIENGRSRFPSDPGLAIDWAQLAAEQDDWHEARERWDSVINELGDVLPAKAFARAAAEYRHQGAVDRAVEVVRRGRERFSDDAGLASQRAQIAMVERDWLHAIVYWDEYVKSKCADIDAGQDREAADGILIPDLPMRAPNLDWHEGAWVDLVRAWPTAQHELLSRPSSELYAAIAGVLRASGRYEEAVEILRLGLALHRGNPELTFMLVVNGIDHVRERPGDEVRADGLRRLSDEVADLDRSASGILEDVRAQIEAALHHRSRDELERFADGNLATSTGLSKIHRIRMPRGSTLELQLRVGRYLDQRAVRDRVRQLSEEEGWRELREGNEPLLQRALDVSETYARSFEEVPYLPAAALAESVFFLIYSELCVFEPMRRLARAIADEKLDGPIFIEVPSSTFTYLNGYAENSLGQFEFGQIYLYFELRRRGTNAFLCEITSSQDVLSPSPLVFKPSRTLMQARPVERNARTPAGGAAVVPAGIRSIEDVIEQIGDPLVLSSGYIIKKYAYDRWFRKGRRLELDSGIHPPRTLLPTIRVELWNAATMGSSQVAFGPRGRAQVPVQVSQGSEREWLDWFDHTMHEYLVDLSRNARSEVEFRDIEEANICDHLFTESSLFAEAVRSRGGRVVLWPHSTNPVHHEVRDSMSFDAVHAITSSGRDRWASRFPGKKVMHNGSLMLPPPRAENPIDPRGPLSVIVLGGKTILGAMPFVHQSQRERSYRRFFEGLRDLQSQHAIDVFYKSKGLLGENEPWLESVVGGSFGWRSITEHPLRIRRPNMLFVSISVGSSALFEGLSRGIPCLIVRDFPTKEYTTFELGAVPIGPSDEMLEVIRTCTNPVEFRALIERQLEYYKQEAGVSLDESRAP